jgi:nitrogen-specific signal transduction histidine kinase/CheY-like chemotaxis protein
MDITDRRMAELEMQKARLETERSAEAKEKFMANVSHELRTPLNGINGFLDLLKHSELSKVQAKWLNLIIQSSDHLLNLVNEILDLYKINQGDSVPESEPFSIAETLNDIAEIFNLQAQNKGLQWEQSILCHSVDICLSDRLRIIQILNNLLSNAIKFTEQGSIAFTAEIIVSDAQHATLTIQIKDTGSGIPSDFIDLVFEPFVKIYHDKQVKFEGTGLGLTITKKVVNSLQGKMYVESIEGQGSTFFVEIPLLLDIAPSHINPTPSDLDEIAGYHIFIAEDHPVNRFLLSTQLMQVGHTTAEAESGAEALLMLQELDTVPDLFIFDINLGDTTGDLLLQDVKRQFPQLSEIPAIALTANMMDDYKEKILKSGFQGYISKPYKAEELLMLIQKLIAKK